MTSDHDDSTDDSELERLAPPILSPDRTQYWDGGRWRPLPDAQSPEPTVQRDSAKVSVSKVPSVEDAGIRSGRFSVRPLLAAAAALVVVAGGLGYVVLHGDMGSSKETPDPKKIARETRYRDMVEGMINDGQPISDVQFAKDLKFGYRVCRDYGNGLTYEASLDKYSGAGMDELDVTSTDGLTEAISNSILIDAVITAAAKGLCPETGVLDHLSN